MKLAHGHYMRGDNLFLDNHSVDVALPRYPRTLKYSQIRRDHIQHSLTAYNVFDAYIKRRLT